MTKSEIAAAFARKTGTPVVNLPLAGQAPAYVVETHTYDTSRPFAVVATFRSFNRVVGRYADASKAKRRARDLNRTHVGFFTRYLIGGSLIP